MTWNYRVMDRDGELAIYSVYYGENGEVKGYSATPTPPSASSIDELRDECHRYLAALDQPILVYEDD